MEQGVNATAGALGLASMEASAETSAELMQADPLLRALSAPPEHERRQEGGAAPAPLSPQRSLPPEPATEALLDFMALGAASNKRRSTSIDYFAF